MCVWVAMQHMLLLVNYSTCSSLTSDLKWTSEDDDDDDGGGSPPMTGKVE